MTTDKAPWRDSRRRTRPSLRFASIHSRKHRMTLESGCASNGNLVEEKYSLRVGACTIPRPPWKKSLSRSDQHGLGRLNG